MKKTLLRKYAKAIVRIGANVQKGQSVRIDAEVSNEEFVALVVDEAYKAGAKKVRVNWSSDAVTKLNYRHQTLKTLSTVAMWQEAKLQEEVDECACRIVILSEDPDGLKGINIEKMQKASQAVRKVTKKYRDALEGKQQWVIAAAPSKQWAKKVFPELRSSAAVEKLWEVILATVYVNDETDPVEEWNRHNESFIEKCSRLNSYKLERIEYKSSNGTDLKVGLIPGAVWMGGGETTLSGIYFNPNMPTEEIFTTPMKGQAEGTVVSTKPLAYQGQIIDKFSITFENGRAVSWRAEQGEELLGKMLTLDEGAAMLGELALVPVDSPISRSGILYFNTLFDENASCHLAIGMGFPNVIEGYEKLSLEEIREMGVNDSITHTDFMIGSEDMSIKGYTKEGKCVEIFRNGNWAI